MRLFASLHSLRVGLKHQYQPLHYYYNAITTTPTAEVNVKSQRDQEVSAYLHIFMVTTHHEQNRFI
jgi:hypothetical protein